MGMEDCRLATRTPIFEKFSNSAFGRAIEKLNLVNEVVGNFIKVNSVDVNATWFNLFIRGKRRCLRDDVDIDALLHQL